MNPAPARSRPASKSRPSGLRRHWLLHADVAFLNHGSFGACPIPILELQQRMRREMETEPVQFLWRRYEERLEASRQIVARWLGARARDLVFVTNATTAVNAVLRSLALRRGDELLTTNHEYNACRNALVERARVAGAKVVTARVPFPLRHPDQVVESVLQAVTRRTRFALLDHVTSSTALVFPIAKLARELERKGIETMVDGAHAPGMVPLKVPGIGCSWYTGNLHKWPCAPKGAAFLWARAETQSRLQPAVVSHGNNTHRPGFTPFQDRFDWAGTFDPTAWFCAGAAIEWMGGLLPGGWPALQTANHELVLEARRLICARLGLEPPCPEQLLGAMAAIPLPERLQGKPRTSKIDPEQNRLHDRFRIEVPFMRFGRPERRWLRISAQIYNTLADYARLAEALAKL